MKYCHRYYHADLVRIMEAFRNFELENIHCGSFVNTVSERNKTPGTLDVIVPIKIQLT